MIEASQERLRLTAYERKSLLQVIAEHAGEPIPGAGAQGGLQIAQGRAFGILRPVELAIEPVVEPGRARDQVAFPEALAARLQCAQAGLYRLWAHAGWSLSRRGFGLQKLHRRPMVDAPRVCPGWRGAQFAQVIGSNSCD
jgi:hypothetical protein